MKVLCVGDSNTYGFDPRSLLGERYPADVRWTGRVRGHEMINWGINGITIPVDHSVYVDLVRRKDPDFVIVMLGTNDILGGKSAEETTHDMESFLDSLMSTGKPILLIAPPVLKLSEFVPTEKLVNESRDLAGLYSELADKKGCRFADAGKWDIELAFDGVHLSPEGHAAFAEKLGALLDDLR